MSRIQNADCRLYTPGHGTHYLHARQHGRDRSHGPVALVDHEVEAHELVLVTKTELIVARHHDVIRVVREVEASAHLRLDRRWHVLRVDNYLANVAIDDAFEACDCGQWQTASRHREEGGAA